MAYPLRFVAAALATAVLCGGIARASSHSDAPLIKQDPQANLTDVYAFVGTKFNDTSKKVLNVFIHVRPFCEPGDGVIYDRFAHEARYTIHLTDPTTGKTFLQYDFTFSPENAGFKNLDTILSYGVGTEVGAIQHVGDARQNYTQTYAIHRRVRGGDSKSIATGLLVPPANAGKRATPFYNDASGVAVSGAATFAALDRYTKETVYDLATGESSFAGLRDDGFFADTPGLFDLLDARILGADGHGQTGNGVDGFKGYNTLAYGLQIPLDLLKDIPNFPKVGVYASVSRPRVFLRGPVPDDANDPNGKQEFVQVNREGNPLFNEVLVNLRDKDNYNFSSPTVDAQRFKKYALAPEVIVLINTVFSTNFQTTNRTDLAGIYIPDVIRVDTSTPPVTLAGQAGFSRLSFIGGDTTKNAAGDTVPSGWPNGRRFGDDVIDIALTAIASGPSFKQIFLLGDNVNANDEVFNFVFPYSATPHSGTRNTKDSGPNKDP